MPWSSACGRRSRRWPCRNLPTWRARAGSESASRNRRRALRSSWQPGRRGTPCQSRLGSVSHLKLGSGRRASNSYCCHTISPASATILAHPTSGSPPILAGCRAATFGFECNAAQWGCRAAIVDRRGYSAWVPWSVMGMFLWRPRRATRGEKEE